LLSGLNAGVASLEAWVCEIVLLALATDSAPQALSLKLIVATEKASNQVAPPPPIKSAPDCLCV
jgi:hypothetical protein